MMADDYWTAYRNASDPNRAARESADRSTLAQLQGMSGVSDLIAKQRKYEQEQVIRGIVTKGGDPATTMAELMKVPGGIEVATHLAQLQEHQAKVAKAAREAAFNSPENRARFMTPGQPAGPMPDQQEVEQSADQGTPPVVQRPAVSSGFDLRGFVNDGASKGVINPEVALNHQAQREQATATLAATNQARRDAAEARRYDTDTRSADRNYATETRSDDLARGREDTAARAREGFALRRELRGMAGANADKSPYSNVQADGAGGFVGLNKSTGKMEKIPQGEGVQSRSDATTQARQDKADEPLQGMLDRLDAVKRMIAANPEVVGGSGMLTRGKEFVTGAMDPSMPTPASNFQTALRDLQTAYRGLPGHAASRLKIDAAQIDEKLKGLGLFTNAAQALGSLDEIRGPIAKQLERRGGGAPAEADPAPAVPKPGAKDKSKSGRPMTFDGTKWVYD